MQGKCFDLFLDFFFFSLLDVQRYQKTTVSSGKIKALGWYKKERKTN